MTVYVDFYQPFKKIVQEKRVSFSFTKANTVTLKELLEEIIVKYPACSEVIAAQDKDNVEKFFRNIAVLRDNNFLLLDCVLEDGDIIKIFPVISGG
ncbi:MAG: MoaD/ThiS family protein [Halanaerobiales bacterium]|nr:MoaD/ThiS family protein [Halanaerobiales bacterium]